MSIKNQIIYNIINTPVQKWPWPHCIFENILPEDLYHVLMDNIPEEDHFVTITKMKNFGGYDIDWSKDKNNLRHVIHDLNQLPESQRNLWMACRDFFTDGQLKQELLTKLRSEIDQHRGPSFFSDVEFYDDFQLTLDKPGHDLPPHTDVLYKVFSIIINLAKDKNNTNMATSIMQCIDKKNMSIVRNTPYWPNTGVGVFKTEESWHGVSPVKENRLTIQYVLYAKEKNNHK